MTPRKQSASWLWFLVDCSTRLWMTRCSLLRVPGWTRPREARDASPRHTISVTSNEDRRYANRRDAIHVASLLLALFLLGTAATWLDEGWTRGLVLVAAVHQVLATSVLMMRLGLFGHHDEYVAEDWQDVPRERRERTLLVLIVNYCSMLLWFAILYAVLRSFDPLAFLVDVHARGDIAFNAFLLSFTTQTTVGYGTVAPGTWLCSAICMTQALYGVLYIALAIANALSILNSGERQR